MFDGLVDGWKARMQLRLALGVIAIILVFAYFGLKETWRCTRAIFGPSTVTYAQATGESGLADYGYVRITGVRAAVERGATVEKRGRTSAGYCPLLPTNKDEQSRRGVVAWFPGSSAVADMTAAAAQPEIVGWVQSTAEYHYGPMNESKLGQMCGARASDVWIVEVNPPSVLKAGIFGGGSIALAVGSVLFLMRRPLEP